MSTTGEPITLSLPAAADAEGVLKTRRDTLRSDFTIEQDEEDAREAPIRLGNGSTRLDPDTDPDITLRLQSLRHEQLGHRQTVSMKLREAAKRGRVERVRQEVESMVSPPLHELLRAATQDFHSIRKGPGHLQLVHYLLEREAAVDSQMVYQAARGGHGEIANILYAHVSSDDLHAAASVGDGTRVSALLLQTHAPDVADAEGKTPLHCCCASVLGREDAEVAEKLRQTATCLLEAGASVDQAATCGDLEQITPLTHTCWTGGDPAMFELLIARGARPTPRTLWAAVGHFQRHGDGNYELAARLLDLGIDVNHNDGRTLLHGFSAHEDARGVRWLLEHGAAVEATDQDGRTPLHCAARRNSGTKVIELLLAAGASKTATDDAGQTAGELALSTGRTKAADLLATD